MQARLREIVSTLAAMERGSASDGERRAAEWIRERFAAAGLDARIEPEPAHGTYWWPLGLCSAVATLAGLSGSRVLGVLGGAAAAAGVVDDVSAGPHLVRKLLPRRTTYNVVAEAGAGGGEHERTLVFIAHHDAAHGGFIFWDKLVTAPMDAFPELLGTSETSPPVMQLVAAGPALVALGSLLGSPRLRTAGTVIAVGCVAAFTDIGLRRVVPGANDNVTAVATELALAEDLELPDGLRVIFLSTGSEESFMEGMRGWMRRHRASLDPATTRFVCLESLGSPQLLVIEGEGMIRMTDYDPADREFLAACAERAGHPTRRGLRLGLATDGLIAMRAGFRTSVLASCTKYKFPANYHSMRDTAENVDYGTVAAAVDVCREVIRAS